MIIAFIILGYLIGSIPFGLILTKLAGYGDIRAIGSGNIGATNVLRTGNKKLAALTLLLDGAKGALPIILWMAVVHLHHPEPVKEVYFPGFEKFFFLIVGFVTVLGHCFPPWLDLKGGKGVATALGVFLATAPLAGLTAIAAWLLTVFAFRFSSLAALVAMAITPIAIFVIYNSSAGIETTSAMAAIISAFVIHRHKANIRRLLKGEEPKIGAKKQHSETLSPIHGGEGKGEGDKPQ